MKLKGEIKLNVQFSQLKSMIIKRETIKFLFFDFDFFAVKFFPLALDECHLPLTLFLSFSIALTLSVLPITLSLSFFLPLSFSVFLILLFISYSFYFSFISYYILESIFF